MGVKGLWKDTIFFLMYMTPLITTTQKFENQLFIKCGLTFSLPLYLATLRLLESFTKFWLVKLANLIFQWKNSGPVKKIASRPKERNPKKGFYMGDRRVWVLNLFKVYYRKTKLMY